MTSTELRRIVGAMTDRPWRAYQHGSMGPDDFVLQMGPDPRQYEILDRDDAAAIVALANHADALVALVKACERWKACTAKGLGSRAEHDLQDALAAVHAILK